MGDRVEHRAAALDASVDALSDVLDLIQLRGEALTAVTASGAAEVHHPGVERLLHIVGAGPVEVVAGDGTAVTLGAGDLALVATGAAHRLRSADGASWMSGRFAVDEAAAEPLLAVLPDAIVLRGADEGFEWLLIGAGLLADELADPSAGSRVMVSRLLDLLFIKSLRAWAADSEGPDPGWLTAALDRPLGPALRAMHRHPERAWSVEELAELASMSRAAFAARFTTFVGDPPARYLTRLRLTRAATLLSTTTDPIGAIGAIGKSVGYVSEPAFSRAFTREYGVAPREWRTARRGP